MKWIPSAVLPLVFSQCASLSPEGGTPEEQRAFIDADAARIVRQLEKESPGSKDEIAESAGYGVFRYSSGKLPLILGGLGAGRGYGVAVDGESADRSYMKVQKINWGWGMGVKESAVVFIFDDRPAFEGFREGKWDGGVAAEANVKAGEHGGGVGGVASVRDGFKAYTLTEAGLSYGFTYQTRRFSPIEKLNR